MLKPYSTQKEASLAHQGTLTNQTLQRLIGWLKDGKFKPGSKLPSQSELVRDLGISRTGVREALQGMVALNLIEIRPGLGCFVKTTSADSFINENVLGILLEKEAILDLIETRKILEGGIAALAAERADKQALWNMEDVLNRLEQAVKRGESVADVATEFHNALAEATHNAVLVKLLRSFNKLMASAGRLVEAEAPSVEHTFGGTNWPHIECFTTRFEAGIPRGLTRPSSNISLAQSILSSRPLRKLSRITPAHRVNQRGR